MAAAAAGAAPRPVPGVPQHHLLRRRPPHGPHASSDGLELAALLDPAAAGVGDPRPPSCGYYHLSCTRHDGTAFDSWNVREAPSKAAEVVGSLPHGTVIGIGEEAAAGGGWLRLAAPSGGWVKREHDGAGWRACGERRLRQQPRAVIEPARLVAQRFAALCLAAEDGAAPPPALLAHWASNAPAGDAPHAPSAQLLFRMRHYIASRRLQLQPLLDAQAAAAAGGVGGVGGAGGGTGPAVTRATFGECPQRMSVVGGGTEVSCSHGPCTMVSAEVASVGVLAWMVVRILNAAPCFFFAMMPICTTQNRRFAKTGLGRTRGNAQKSGDHVFAGEHGRQLLHAHGRGARRLPGEKKRLFWEPFLYSNDHFAKTGSGQTQGKRSTKGLLSSRPTSAALPIAPSGGSTQRTVTIRASASSR